MIAMTTSSSTSVNALRSDSFDFIQVTMITAHRNHVHVYCMRRTSDDVIVRAVKSMEIRWTENGRVAEPAGDEMSS
jgi:hypothetical protein